MLQVDFKDPAVAKALKSSFEAFATPYHFDGERYVGTVIHDGKLYVAAYEASASTSISFNKGAAATKFVEMSEINSKVKSKAPPKDVAAVGRAYYERKRALGS